MLRTRLILGTLSVASVIGLAYLDQAIEAKVGSGFVFFVVLCLLGALGALELAKMLQRGGVPASAWVLIVGSLAGLSAIVLPSLDPSLLGAPAVLPTALFGVLLLQAIELMRMKRVERATSCLASSQLATVYLGVLPAFFVLICHDHGPFMVLVIVLVIKTCDIGAYFIGTAIGKHKLIPWLSPAKSWEGLVGGMLCAAMVGAIAVSFFRESTSIPVWLGALGGLVLGLVGQGGDLVESLMKRSAGVKDSGVVPGFGGVLDMIDSPILAAPVAYWLLEVATTL